MSDARATLRELRRTRTKRRLGSTDWYDIAYRVYLFAFAGLVARRRRVRRHRRADRRRGRRGRAARQGAVDPRDRA